MDCESFGKYLDNYESLTEQEKSDMDEHAAKCEECRAELDFFLSMISTVKSLPKEEPPSDFMDKLNARLDAEDKRVVSASGILGHSRRYGIQYAAAAACLALVAVITANRSLLTDRMSDVPDGVIREETTVSDGSARSDSTPAPSAVTPSPTVPENSVQPSAAPEAVSGAKAAEAPRAQLSSASAQTPRRSVPSAAPRVTSSSATAAPASASVPRTVSEPAAVIDNNAGTPVFTEIPEPSAPEPVNEPSAGTDDEIAAVSGEEIMQRSVPEPETGYEPSDNAARESYSIALASIVRNSDEPEVYDLRPEEVAESIKPDEIQANYSLADEGDIARGKYSKLNRDGIPIESATAIGSIKFSADDEERAMDVINRYTVDEKNNIYTTDSVNLTLILSKLKSEGIPFSDYTVSGSGEVKFKVEFN